MLKQFETLNILPIAQGQRVCIPSCSPRFDLSESPRPRRCPFEKCRDPYNECCRNSGVPAPRRKLERIDLKRRKRERPLDDRGLSHLFVGLILQRKQLTRDSLLSLLQDRGRLVLQGFSAVREIKLRYLFISVLLSVEKLISIIIKININI